MTAPTNETLAAVLCGILLGLCLLVAMLGGMRWYRIRKRNLLPIYQHEKLDIAGSNDSHSSTFTITTSATSSKTIFVNGESKERSSRDSSCPSSPLPEIRITFPEEVDEAGKRQSGRCVVVRISEHGSEGFEPYDEKLPSYQRDANDRFTSLDLERIGGLQDKHMDKAMAAA